MLLLLHLLWNALNNAPSNRAAPSPPSLSLVLLILPLAMILFRLFPIRCPVIIAAAVYSASFAFAGTRTQDLFSHLYVCWGGGGAGGEELAGM